MNTPAPIKRITELQPASRDHHHALLLAWKIRNGLKRGVDIERIKGYTEWFFNTYQLPHFLLEEQYIFPVMKNDNHPHIIKVLQEHQVMKDMIMKGPDDAEALLAFADILETHIRFEERVLFNEIQQLATPEQLAMIAQQHTDAKFTDHPTLKFI